MSLGRFNEPNCRPKTEEITRKVFLWPKRGNVKEILIPGIIKFILFIKVVLLYRRGRLNVPYGYALTKAGGNYNLSKILSAQPIWPRGHSTNQHKLRKISFATLTLVLGPSRGTVLSGGSKIASGHGSRQTPLKEFILPIYSGYPATVWRESERFSQ